MKLLRILLAFAVIGGLASVAKAEDFQIGVVDPQPSYVTPITSDSFTFNFSPCQSGQLPSGTPLGGFTYVGCFTGQNDTGAPLTSLQLLVPPIPGQSAGCSAFGGGFDIFSDVTCGEYTSGPLNGYFYLNFSGGSIAAGTSVCANDGDDQHNDNSNDDGNNGDDDCGGGIFTIAEAGVTPDAFPQVDATFNAAPEPAPALLLSTGLLMGGLFYVADRRRALAIRHR